MDAACEKVENKIREDLMKAESVSLTSDDWTAKNNKHIILSMTAHFVDEDGEPAHHRAAVMPLFADHDPETLAAVFKGALQHYGLDVAKVHVLLRNDGSNMIKLARLVGLDNIWCFAHLLQRAAEDGFKELPSLSGLVDKCKKIVRKLRKSNAKSKRFEQLLNENDLPQMVLIKDVETRWNSIYLMMKRLLLLRSAVEQLIAGSASYPLVDADEWKTMQMVVVLLQPIYDSTLALQERMTTAAGILPLYFTIMQKQAPATGLVRMHDAIIGGLNKRMEGCRENRLLVIATVLDPRLKLSQFAEGDRRSIQEMLESVALEKCAEGGTESHASSDDDVEGEDFFMKFISLAEPVATPGEIWIDRPSSTAKAKIEIIENLKELRSVSA